MLHKIFSIFILMSFVIAPLSVQAQIVQTKETYPRLANHFLKWGINLEEASALSKWDVLILDPEDQNNKEELALIRKNNPQIKILAYVSPQEIINEIGFPEKAPIKAGMLDKIKQADWWVRDVNGNKMYFWQGTSLLNVTDYAKRDSNNLRWNEYLPSLVVDNILSTGLWDGIFYDSMVPSMPPTNNNQVDINYDGKVDTQAFLDTAWRNGLLKILQNTRKIVGNRYIIIGNSASSLDYQGYLNGRTYESFPTPWEGNGTWEATMNPYLKILPTLNQKPLVYTLNSNTNNSGNQADYRKMRFGLASTLLGEGYFSFDYGDQSHAQAWWYDEYDVNLGKTQSSAYNLLDKNNANIKAGLWRRDFDNGVAIVNSTKDTQTYVFKEEFEKIKGTQDRAINNGEKVNWLKLNPNDGIILLKINTEITDSAFNNGGFVRVFNNQGQQTRNGFFAYKENYPGNTQILISDIDDDGQNETLVNGNGEITIYKNGKVISKFKPYEGKFKGKISFAVEDLNGDGTKEVITGAGAGGGPHVRIFNSQGKMLTGGFFAYDKNFRGGVNIAVIDLNGDGTKEVITGAGAGGGPHVRIFSKDGKALGGFFAYDQNFKGGVSVAVGDVNGDGVKEIITGAGAGGGPEVRIFNAQAKLLNKFLAYSADMKTGIQVMSSDIGKQGVAQILVGTISF